MNLIRGVSNILKKRKTSTRNHTFKVMKNKLNDKKADNKQ
jgi:hypothetical protein